jgi:hypothetical protein
LLSPSSSPSLSPSVSHQTKIILKGEAPRRVHFVLHIKSPINILHYFAETEKHLKNDTFKKKNINRHGPRPVHNVCHLSYPTCFSLQTAFKAQLPKYVLSAMAHFRGLG